MPTHTPARGDSPVHADIEPDPEHAQAAHAAHEPGLHTMQCMEVWGGNAAADRAVNMTGIDAWVHSRPFGDHSGGGDVHYLSSCATGRITRILVADVAGHGSHVADTALTLREIMRRNINFLDQRRVTQAINRQFSELAELGRFATAVVATYFAPTDTLEISNAGHPRPMLYRAAPRPGGLGSQAKPGWSVLVQPHEQPGAELADIPLGIAEPTTYSQSRVDLGPGDLLLLYTDSLVESRAKNGRGSMLGETGLLEMLASLDASRPTEIINALLQKLDTFRGGRPADDDVTVLLITPNARKPISSFRAGMLATGRIVRSFFRAIRRHEPFGRPEVSVTNLGGSFFDPLNRLGRGKQG